MKRLRIASALIAVVLFMVGLGAVPAYADPEDPGGWEELVCDILNCEDITPDLDKCDVSAGADAWQENGGVAGRGNGGTGCNDAYGQVDIRINVYSPTAEPDIRTNSDCCTSVTVQSGIMYAPNTPGDDCYKTFAFGSFNPAPKNDSDHMISCA